VRPPLRSIPVQSVSTRSSCPCLSKFWQKSHRSHPSDMNLNFLLQCSSLLLKVDAAEDFHPAHAHRNKLDHASGIFIPNLSGVPLITVLGSETSNSRDYDGKHTLLTLEQAAGHVPVLVRSTSSPYSLHRVLPLLFCLFSCSL
jgi:hypothetical protein